MKTAQPANNLTGLQSPPAQSPKKPGRLRNAFNKVVGYLKKDPLQPAAIVASILLGTTALATPVLGTALTAGLAMAGGFYLLTKTSDTVINNASSIGKKMGMKPLMLGVILGAVTSMPELFVSISSALGGEAGLGIGNIVGSNIANLLLILGATASITKLKSSGKSWKFNTLAMAGATAGFGVALATGMLTQPVGWAALGLLGAYMVGFYRKQKKDGADQKQEKEPDTTDDKMPKWFNTAMGVAGVAGLVTAAGFVVKSASATATLMGVPPEIVGALAVAVGTSLPELMVNVKSALRGKTEMAIGNVVGSNIFNILMVGGTLALFNTAVPVAFGLGSTLGLMNLGVFGASAALATAAFMKNKGGLKRWHGIAALGLYAAFTAASIGLGGTGAEAADALSSAPEVITQTTSAISGTAPPPVAPGGP